MQDKPMTIIQHLDELRKVLIRSIIFVIAASVFCYAYREQLVAVLSRPVNNLHIKLVFLSPTEALFTQLKVILIAGVILALPFILWQIWSYILPALHVHEKRTLIFLVILSLLLFIIGTGFAYLTVFPIGVRLLLTMGWTGVEPMISIGNYVSFTISFLLPFGIVFEMPLVILFLARLGIVTPAFLVKKRKFAILIIFVVAAVLTPGPDMVSQALMAGPMLVLYEISILLAKLVKKKQAGKTEVLQA